MSAAPPRHGNGAIVASFLVALALTIVPLPDWLAPLRPEFAALVLIYWCLAIPTRVGVGVGWLTGLTVDVIKGTLLGQHALGFTMIAYVAAKEYRRVRVHPLWQQSLTVLVLLAFQQFLVMWIYGMMGRPPTSWLYWAPSFIGMLLWPWTFRTLRWLRRRNRIV